MRIRINPWFLALLAFYFFTGLLYKALLVFLLVTGHELAHALIARLLGIRVREIELLPVGGVARLEGPLEVKPFTDMLISGAGPFFNVFILAVIFSGYHFRFFPENSWSWPGIQYLWRINILLLVFNLMPALPLDGGRIYRSWLAMKYGLKKATVLTLTLSRWLAVLLLLLGIIGLYFSLTGIDFFFIVLFLFYAAKREDRQTPFLFWRTILQRQQLNEIMRIADGRLLIVKDEMSLAEVGEQLGMGNFHLIAILDKSGRLSGLITEHELLERLLSGQGDKMFKEILA